MAKSQNGWPVFTNGADPGLVAIPEVAGRVRAGDVASLFTWLVGQFDKRVEKVGEAAGQPQDDWGWANRPVTGSAKSISNHASGTAIDLNAPKHPIGKVGTFNAAQVREIHSILATINNVIRWGGDYKGRKDEMHFEINATASQVAAAVRKIAGGTVAPAPAPSKPKPVPVKPNRDLMRGSTGTRVRTLQATLKRNYPLYAKHLVVDGAYGPATEKVVREFQRRAGLRVDGIAGPATFAKLGIKF